MLNANVALLLKLSHFMLNANVALLLKLSHFMLNANVALLLKLSHFMLNANVALLLKLVLETFFFFRLAGRSGRGGYRSNFFSSHSFYLISTLHPTCGIICLYI
jgi:hypothetical protein